MLWIFPLEVRRAATRRADHIRIGRSNRLPRARRSQPLPPRTTEIEPAVRSFTEILAGAAHVLGRHRDGFDDGVAGLTGGEAHGIGGAPGDAG